MSTLRERVDLVLPLLSVKGIGSMRAWHKAADVSDAYLNRRMTAKGGRPDFKMFERLAEVAGVDARWLAYGDGPAPVVVDTGVLETVADVSRARASAPATSIDRALFGLMVGVDFAPEDFDAARAALRQFHHLIGDADPQQLALRYLRAAHRLRAMGLPTEPGDIGNYLAMQGDRLVNEAVADRETERGTDELARLGGAPASKAKVAELRRRAEAAKGGTGDRE